MEVRKDFEQLFSSSDPAMPAGLTDAILARIERERVRQLKIKAFFLFVLSAAAAAAIVPAWQELHRELSRSGFSQFVSLLVSDSSVALLYWKDFAFSLLESLPVVGAAALFAAFFALLSSLRSLVLDVSAILAPPLHRSGA